MKHFWNCVNSKCRTVATVKATARRNGPHAMMQCKLCFFFVATLLLCEAMKLPHIRCDYINTFIPLLIILFLDYVGGLREEKDALLGNEEKAPHTYHTCTDQSFREEGYHWY